MDVIEIDSDDSYHSAEGREEHADCEDIKCEVIKSEVIEIDSDDDVDQATMPVTAFSMRLEAMRFVWWHEVSSLLNDDTVFLTVCRSAAHLSKMLLDHPRSMKFRAICPQPSLIMNFY